MRTNQNPKSKYICLASAIAFFCMVLPLWVLSTPAHASGGFPIIGVLHAGSHPEGIAVDTQTHMVYIAYEYPSSVVGFDPSSGKVRWSAPVTDSVTDVQVDSNSHHVYVIGSLLRNKQGVLTILDGATGQTLLTTNTGFGDNALALDPRRQRVYVSSSEDGRVYVFKLATSASGKLTATASTLKFGPRPQALGVNSRSGRLYIGDTTKNTVTVYDEDSGHTLAIIPVANVPVQPLRVDEATGRVYVICSAGQELDIIDGHNNTVLAHIPVSPYPEGVAFNTATGRIYVADEGSNEGNPGSQSNGTTITVIDGQSFDVLGTLQIGRAPDGVEADPQLQRVYIAVEDSDAVVEISDSVDLPLKPDTNFHQAAAVHQAISVLQQAAVITTLLMIVTIIGAILASLLPRWRARENLQSPPGGASSH